MKYFLDTEFSEGIYKPAFGKKRWFIELISIGLVCEDGREYYAISNEFNYKRCNPWVKDNVIPKLKHTASRPDVHGRYNFYGMDAVFAGGKPNRTIAREIIDFMKGGYDDLASQMYVPGDTQVYAYYAGYDWVMFCTLFGRMIDLPAGMPMFCMDIKQMMEERGLTKEWKQSICPDPVGEHNALVDAKWNKSLYDAILSELK